MSTPSFCKKKQTSKIKKFLNYNFKVTVPLLDTYALDDGEMQKKMFLCHLAVFVS